MNARNLENLTRLHLFCFAILITVSVAASGREIVVSFVPRNTTMPVNGTLIIAQSGDSTVVHQKFSLQSGTATIDVPPGPEWTIRLDGDGWWAAQQTIPAETAASPTVVSAWQTGVVRGRFSVVNGQAMPEVAQLVVETPPDLRAPPEIARGTTFDCPVDDAGTWSCRIPATALDVVIHAAGFSPVYRWDLKVDPARDTLLGAIPLRRGASLVAWLDGESTKSLEGPARARLLRAAGGDSPVMAARLAAPVAEATFGKRGGVQLADVPPGVYLLEVTARGFAPARISPIEILEQREAVLRRPVVLERPLTLQIAIDPPADPSGAPWTLELRRIGDFGESADSAPIPVRPLPESPGTFEARDQSTGRYTLAVLDARRALRVTRRLDIASAAEAQQTISIPFARVRGTVTFAGEPVAARLSFGGRNGAERITLDTNADGRFEGWLSRAGSWPVDVDAIADEASTNVDVVVSESEEDIVIEIPDTMLSGTVLDAGGERGLQSTVTLISERSGGRELRTKPDGTFRFRGLREGETTLRARDLRTAETSPAVSVTVVEGTAKQIELRIEPGRKLIGIVTSGGAPVAGAMISAYPIVAGWVSQVRTASDLTGRFELQLPASTRRALVAVRAAGRVLQSFDLAVGDKPALLDLATRGGTVRLLLPPSPSTFVLQRDGVVVPTIDLMRWVQEQGQRAGDGSSMTFPDLAPGIYQACIPNVSRCVQHVLTANAVVDVDLR